MLGMYENKSFDEKSDDWASPVVSLKEGLPLSELLSKHQTEFEVRPDEDESTPCGTSASTFFDFEKVEKVVNLDLLDLDQSEEGEDNSPFDKYRRKMHNLREDGKIMKYVVKSGNGCLVPDNSVVYVQYQAYVEFEEVPFDSTLWQSNSEGDFPVPINMAKGQAIPGFHEALVSMRKGEKAEFLIHPDLAFGKLGCVPRIPQEATILFVVEVDRFIDCGDMHSNNDDLSMEERSQYCNVIKSAKGHYAIGTDLFTKNNYNAANNKFRHVINLMHNARLANEEEELERNRFLIKNYVNSALCYHKLNNYKKVCSMSADAMRVSETESMKNFKLLYFWGYAKMMLGDYAGAKKHLLASKKLKPLSSEIAVALKELEKKKNDALQTERLMMRRAFNFEPTKAKVKEVDEAEEQFRKNIREHLEEFKNNSDKDMLTLKDRFSIEEENVCIGVAKDLGLYARVADGEMRVIVIRKPTRQ